MFVCSICKQRFSRKDTLTRHSKVHSAFGLFDCEICGKGFSRIDSLKRHTQCHVNAIASGTTSASVSQTSLTPFASQVPVASTSKQNTDTYNISVANTPTTSQVPVASTSQRNNRKCDICNLILSSNRAYLGHLRSQKHKSASLKDYIDEEPNIKIIQSAFQSRIVSYQITDAAKGVSIENFLDAVESKVIQLIKNQIDVHITSKINMELFAMYYKETSERIVRNIKSFNTKNIIITHSSLLDDEYHNFKVAIISQSEEFQDCGSGWTLEEVLHLEVNINKYVPLRGEGTYRDLPDYIKCTKAVLNVHNNDNACFAWCVVAALHPAKDHPNRMTSYPHYQDILNLKGIQFPVTFTKISKFERINNVSVNVYGIEKKVIVGPIHFSQNKCINRPHINLLYIDKKGKRNLNIEDDEEEGDDCETSSDEEESDDDDENDKDWTKTGDEDISSESECNFEDLESKSSFESEYEDDSDSESESDSTSDIRVNAKIKNGHFCLIKDLSKLVGAQISKRAHKIHICDGCLLYFRTEFQLKLHISNDCNRVKTILPEFYDNILKFKNYRNKIDVPFIIYADFEVLLVPIVSDIQTPKNINKSSSSDVMNVDVNDDMNDDMNVDVSDDDMNDEINDDMSNRPFTRDIQEHVPYGFSYYIKCSYDNSLNKLIRYRGVDCIQVFHTRIAEELKPIYEKLRTIVPLIPLTNSQHRDYVIADRCHICNGTFNEKEKNYRKVIDHCHLSGKYRGPAHSVCNLNYKLENIVPIVCHNLSNYDLHLIVKELGSSSGDINVIPKTKEKYISLTKNIFVAPKKIIQLRFIDSFRFMSRSLDVLVSNLTQNELNETSSIFTDPIQMNLACRKGVFPYEYIDSMDKLSETALPSKDKFYNSLTGKHISNEDYLHAQNV